MLKEETKDENDVKYWCKHYRKQCFLARKIKIASNKVADIRKKISKKMKQIGKEIVIDFKLSKIISFMLLATENIRIVC